MNFNNLLGRFIGKRKRLRKYAISEATVLADLLKDINELKRILEDHNSGNRNALLKHFKKEAKRNERKAEYLERRLNRVLRAVENSFDNERGRFSNANGALAEVQNDLEIAGNNLVRLIAYEKGKLHDLLQEKEIDWDLVSAKVKEAIGDNSHPGILSILASLKKLDKLDQTLAQRRGFIKEAAATAAALSSGAVLLGKSQAARGDDNVDQNIADYILKKQVTREEQIKAIESACDEVEKLCYDMTTKLSSPILFTPHADYTHFNRVGKWSHKMILEDSSLEYSIDIGATSRGIHEDQRVRAERFMQPTDKEVSFTERSLVTLANMKGRGKVKGKLFTVKHFPGGPPEIEFTEVRRFLLNFSLGEMISTHMKPFIDVLQLREVNAVMISHAEFPDMEKELSKKCYKKYETPVAKELEALGIQASAYVEWTLNRPASLSPTLIRGLLKESLKFKGIVVPDAMNMGAIVNCAIKLGMSVDTKIYDRLNDDDKYIIEILQSYNFALTFILGIYAGLDYFLCHHLNDREIIAITKYTQRSPYFQECLKLSFERYQSIFKIIGETVPIIDESIGLDNVFKNIIKILSENEAFGFSSRQDPWDRSGAIHRYFRAHYLAALYEDNRFELDGFRGVFWIVHQRINWKELDPLFQEVIKNKYKVA